MTTNTQTTEHNYTPHDNKKEHTTDIFSKQQMKSNKTNSKARDRTKNEQETNAKDRTFFSNRIKISGEITFKNLTNTNYSGEQIENFQTFTNIVTW